MNAKRTLPLDEAVESMIIADSLLDPHGNVLLPSGASLTASSINSLRRRGVETICIVAEDEPDPDLQAKHEQIRMRLTKIFRKSYDQEANRALADFVCIYRTGKKHE